MMTDQSPPPIARRLDNMSQYYKNCYAEACELLKANKKRAALNVAFDILEQPDVGLYRRAVVNLFVSINGDFFSLNLADYAIECLNLLKRLRDTTTAVDDDGVLTTNAVEAIECIEHQAIARLHEIHALAVKVQTDDRADEEVQTHGAAGDLAMEDEATDSGEEDDEDSAMEDEATDSGEDDDDGSQKDKVNGRPFQIMGMFTRQPLMPGKERDSEMLDVAGEMSEREETVGGLSQQLTKLEATEETNYLTPTASSSSNS